MKIIQVCSKYYPEIGGIETHVKELSEALVKMGHDVEVVCTYSSHKLPEKDIINGVKVTRFWAFAPGEAYYFSPMIYFYLRDQVYDVIHAHNYHSFPALFAALASKKRFIFTPHSSGFQKSFIKRIFYSIYKPFGSHIFDKADKIISITQKEREMLIENFNMPEDKTIYLPLPINLIPRSKPKSEKKFINIGFFGRLSPEKDVGTLILAFKIVKKEYNNCNLFISGDGPLRKELENIGKSVEGVHFLGPLFNKNLNDFIEDIDVFVLPSRFEVSPRAVIEAMSRGIPAIATPVGELPQTFKNGENILFSRLNDPCDMAEKILLLLRNRKLADEIGNAGKKIVEEKYDLNKIIYDYIKIYTDEPENYCFNACL